MIELLNVDCMELLQRTPDNYYSLSIVDVPYGIGEDGSNNKSRGKLARAKDYKHFAGNDKESPDANYWNQILRVSKNQIVWGANHFISKIPLDSPCWIIWDKNNGDNDFADCELAWTSFKTAARKFKFTWNGMLQENMQQKENRIHPTQKPVALYKWLLTNYAKPGDRILDTHLGSGSIAIACHDMGFDLVGCELDKDYYEAACNRLKTHQQQQSLFDPKETFQHTQQKMFGT